MQTLTMVIHPNTIGTQLRDASSHEVIMDFTQFEDYNANRHAAEKWLSENGYVHMGGSDYEKAANG